MKTYLLIIFALLFQITAFAQQQTAQKIKGLLVGRVLATDNTSLPGASLRWLGSNRGGQTDPDGWFKIQKQNIDEALIVSFVGLIPDTVHVHDLDTLTIVLLNNAQLSEVRISARSSSVDERNPIHTEIINAKGLAKAACCNLSETFETNASVSVSYTDAITGAKQIQMLGLAGTYIQTNTENIPNIRGLNTAFGLNYTPGTWVNSISVSKGVGSVVNGYESLAGAINVELVKPEDATKTLVNAYVNSFGRGELNLNFTNKINKKWASATLLHASGMNTRLDKNKDSFLDLPRYGQLNGIQRWKYETDRWMAQFGVKALTETRLGGQTERPNAYTFGNTTRRAEVFGKIARLYPKQPYKGTALIINSLVHDVTANFGFRKYTGRENSLYANFIYQNIIQDTRHTYKIGASTLVDDYLENYTDSTFKRTEVVPGFFAEYTLALPELVTVVLGNRVDFHNIFGIQTSPRLHVLFHLPSEMHLHLSAGRGWRVPNPIAENFGLLVNSRSLIVKDHHLNPEVAWNTGVGLSKHIDIGGREGSVAVDFYRTSFENQLIMDMETVHKLYVYNGKSYANSFQVEANIQPLPRTEVKLAYRFFDVWQEVRAANGDAAMLPKMFVNRDRILFNIGWADNKYERWKIDFTWQWNGKRRIPDTTPGHIHETTSPPVFAPAFSNINAQITRNFSKVAVYLGGENLNNFTQKNPIMSANDPFSRHFDASMVWGPIIGRMIYAGFRWKP